MERHGSIENYVNAKFKLVTRQSRKDFAYINSKDMYLQKKIKKSRILSKIINVNFKTIDGLKKQIKNPYFFSQGNKENLSFIFRYNRNS